MYSQKLGSQKLGLQKLSSQKLNSQKLTLRRLGLQRAYAQKSSLASGFTLIELMITIAVLGIVVSIAYPSMQNSFNSWRMKQSAGDVLYVFQTARSQALNHSQVPVNYDSTYTKWSYAYSKNKSTKTVQDLTIENGVNISVQNGTVPSTIIFEKTGRSNVSGAVDLNVCIAGSGLKSYTVTLYGNGSSEMSRGNTTCT